MSTRLLNVVCTTIGIVFFLTTVIWPVAAMLISMFDFNQPPQTFFPTSRQWTLLGKTAGWAALAALLAVVFSLPAAHCLGHGGSKDRAPVLMAALLIPLLCPPMVYAFGWQRLSGLRADGAPYLGSAWHTVLVWACWAWPIPAMILGAAWSRHGRSAYEAALLNCKPATALARTTLPAMRGSIVAAFGIVWILLLNEYSVPHACGLIVYATELLGLASSSSAAAEVVLLAAPVLVVVLAVLFLMRQTWRRIEAHASFDESASDAVLSSHLMLPTLAVTVLTAVLPSVSLVCRMNSWGDALIAIRTYDRELIQSLTVAAATGLVVMTMSVAVATQFRGIGLAMSVAVLMGLIPGAVTGEAVVVAYRSIPFVYDHWPLVVIGLAARFAWIGVFITALALHRTAPELAEQARTDGADEAAVTTRVRLWPQWPLLLSGAGVVAVLSLSEIAVASLVQVPSVGLISLIIIEKFHRLEDAMLAALSLWLILPALLVSITLTLAIGVSRSSRRKRGSS